MRIKNSNLKWNVLCWDTTTNELKNYDVMRGLAEELHDEVKRKTVYDRRTLKEWLKHEFMYHYWSKAEFEIGVAGLHECDWKHAKKVDVWRQLEPNLDTIVEYINIRCDLNYK